MFATRSLTAPVSFEFRRELLQPRCLAGSAQTYSKNVGLMSFNLAGAHQLRISNTIDEGKAVKKENPLINVSRQLVPIHYWFATGLQEKMLHRGRAGRGSDRVIILPISSELIRSLPLAVLTR